MNAVEAVKQVLLHSGSDWVLWLLGALSVLSLAIIVERWMFFRSRDSNIRELAKTLDEQLTEKKWDEAIKALSFMPTAAASIAAAGLRLAGRGPTAVDKAMQSAAALERGQLEKRLTTLGTIGNNAPFIGLFGTVIGIIHAFEELGTGAGAGPGQVASAAIMASLAEARQGSGPSTVVQTPGRSAEGQRLALEAVDYDQQGNVVLSGRAPPQSSVQVYLDNQSAGGAKADEGGRWTLTPPNPVAPGIYTMRVDEMGKDGKVASRVETPFARADASDVIIRGDQIVVQPGNSLWRISRAAYGQGVRFTVIYEANREQIRDPALIYPGQIFGLPKVN